MNESFKSVDKKRLEWVDSVKGVTVLLVAFYHAYLACYQGIGIVNNGSIIDSFIGNFNYYAFQVRMPTFFAVSGLVFSLITGNKMTWFWRKRAPFMLWIIFLWTLISIIVENLGLHLYPWASMPLFVDGYKIPMPYGNIWFIYALLAVSFFSVLINDLSVNKKIIIMMGFSIVVHFYLVLFPPAININMWLLKNLAYKAIPFFILGSVFSNQIIKISENYFHVFMMTVSALLIWVVLSVFFDPVSDYGQLITRYIPGTLAFLGCIILLSRQSLFRKAFRKVGQHSLEIFLLHQFFIAICLSLYNKGYFAVGGEAEKIILLSLPIVTCIAFVFSFQRLIKPLLFTPPFWWEFKRHKSQLSSIHVDQK